MKKLKFLGAGGIGVIALLIAVFGTVSAGDTSTIDFEGLGEGTIVGNLSSGSGISGAAVAGSVSVVGVNPDLAGNQAMVFDATCQPGGAPANCTGGDFDLFQPSLVNVLIVSEDGDSSDPDDADLVGEMFDFDFSAFGPTGVVTVDSIDALDIETGEGEGGASINVYSGGLGGILLASIGIPDTGQGGLINVPVDVGDVDFMRIILNGSGAIDNIEITVEEVMPAFARITGGGWRVSGTNGESIRSSNGLTLHCDIELANNLQINWNGGQKWHINKLVDAAFCLDDPDFTPEPPAAPADTYIGIDVGKLNNDTSAGSFACFIFTDHGEVASDPDGEDQALIRIWDVGFDPEITADDLDDAGFDCSSDAANADANLVLSVDLQDVDGGNLQFHFDQPHGNGKNK